MPKAYRGRQAIVSKVILKTEDIPTIDSLLKDSISVWEEGHKNCPFFVVSIYLPGMDISSDSYSVTEFTPEGWIKFTINTNALTGTKWEQYAENSHI